MRPTSAADGADQAAGQQVSGNLQLIEVAKSYGLEQALWPTSFEVRNGEFLTILGPSGSGKTTVLRLIGGFTQVSSGRIMIDNNDITLLPANKRPCNTVFQDYALFPHKTAASNIGYGLMVRGQRRAEVDIKVGEALRLVGLESMGSKYPIQLSGGQQQRVALARSLVCEPRVLLLDEPLSALDADMRRQMQQFLKKIQREIRTTFILVTHDQEEAITLSDRIAVMNRGKLEQIATPHEVYYRPQTHFVATFLGDNNLLEGTVLARSAIDLPIGRVGDVRSGRPAGAKIFAAIRPERIGLNPTPVPGKINIAAQVIDVSFAGAMSTVRIVPDALPNQTFLIKVTSGRRIEEMAAGQSIHAVIDAADLSIFPREAI